MDLLTRQEAADHLRVSLSNFKKTIQKQLPFVKLGRRVLFDKKDLDDYLESKKQNKGI